MLDTRQQQIFAGMFGFTMGNFGQESELSIREQELSKIVLLSSCPGILSQSPFDLPSRVFFQCSSSDLEAPHGHSGADLCQLHISIAGLDKDMMANFNAIFHVLEGDYPIADLVRAIPGRKDML